MELWANSRTLVHLLLQLYVCSNTKGTKTFCMGFFSIINPPICCPYFGLLLTKQDLLGKDEENADGVVHRGYKNSAPNIFTLLHDIMSLHRCTLFPEIRPLLAKRRKTGLLLIKCTDELVSLFHRSIKF